MAHSLNNASLPREASAVETPARGKNGRITDSRAENACQKRSRMTCQKIAVVPEESRSLSGALNLMPEKAPRLTATITTAAKRQK